MNQENIRNYIEIASTMLTESEEVVRDEVIITEDTQVQPQNDLENEFNRLIFKLRSYQDPESGEYSAGMEAGMSRAADMIENMLTRLRGN
jgi:hypothetical protein